MFVVVTLLTVVVQMGQVRLDPRRSSLNGSCSDLGPVGQIQPV